MSQQNIALLTLTILSTGALAANRFATPAGAQAGADANTIGVSRTAAVGAGENIPVDALGTTLVLSGAAFAKGASLKSDANGKAITWASSGAKVAIALEAATAADQLIEVFLVPNVA